MIFPMYINFLLDLGRRNSKHHPASFLFALSLGLTELRSDSEKAKKMIGLQELDGVASALKRSNVSC